MLQHSFIFYKMQNFKQKLFVKDDKDFIAQGWY